MNGTLASVNVQNVSRDPERYIVARLVDGAMWYYGSWGDVDEAYDAAGQFDNAIVLTLIGE